MVVTTLTTVDVRVDGTVVVVVVVVDVEVDETVVVVVVVVDVEVDGMVVVVVVDAFVLGVIVEPEIHDDGGKQTHCAAPDAACCKHGHDVIGQLVVEQASKLIEEFLLNQFNCSVSFLYSKCN